MQYSNQERRTNQQFSQYSKYKTAQNRTVNVANTKDYEDEQNSIALKNSDSSQVRDLKGKIKLVMTKLTSVKKQRDDLQKQNKTLQQEVTVLQTNLRQMVSGFSNTSSTFPTHNQIGSRFAQFYKYQCLDLFFDLLCPDMNMKGIIAFYFYSFKRIQELIDGYFMECFSTISRIGCFQTIQGPILNVLRKSFQTTYKQILQNLKAKGYIDDALQYLKNQMKQNFNQENEQRIKQFLSKITQLKVYCLASDPPFQINIKQIGTKVQFNPLQHDPFDGFIKPKDDCWIVLPSVSKCCQAGQNVTKCLVLQVGYDEDN